MRVILAALCGALAGFCLGRVITLRHAKTPTAPENQGLDKPSRTTTKYLVWLCLCNGIAWVWCSYLLAWLGREEIAESLSKAAVTEIVGVVLVYAAKSLFENLSKNNSWPDRPAGGSEHQDCD